MGFIDDQPSDNAFFNLFASLRKQRLIPCRDREERPRPRSSSALYGGATSAFCGRCSDAPDLVSLFDACDDWPICLFANAVWPDAEWHS